MRLFWQECGTRKLLPEGGWCMAHCGTITHTHARTHTHTHALHARTAPLAPHARTHCTAPHRTHALHALLALLTLHTPHTPHAPLTLHTPNALYTGGVVPLDKLFVCRTVAVPKDSSTMCVSCGGFADLAPLLHSVQDLYPVLAGPLPPPTSGGVHR